MQVSVAVAVVEGRSVKDGKCLTQQSDGQGITFTTPKELLEADFPVKETAFSFDRVIGPNAPPQNVFESMLNGVASGFLNRQNTVLYSYGERGNAKRQLFFGTSAETTETPSAGSGVAQRIVKALFDGGFGKGGEVLKVAAYVLGVTENVSDLLDTDNTAAVVAESMKDGPNVANLTRQTVASEKEGVDALRRIAESIEDEFADVLLESNAVDEPFPAYCPFHVVLNLLLYKNAQDAEEGLECNSITFIALGDSERPPLCGIDLEQLNKYERAHKTHSAVVGVLGAIRCNRLRVPFTKSKLTSLLKRAYNQEKNNKYNEGNKPTQSFLFPFVFADAVHAEETYHTLMMAKRIVNVMGSGGVGPASRDLSVEKWRLEQDIIELRDELTIAKAVHDYKPVISDQSKPIQNIQEEELKRITAINKRREEARAKAQAEMRMQAQKEAQLIIEQEEKKSNSNLKELEDRLKEKLLQNTELASDRDKKIKEFDKQLEKIRKKKKEEEEKAQKLVEEVRTLEDELNARNLTIAKARQQLELLSKDHAKGRELILQSREDTKENRVKEFQQRRKQRETWLKEIDETNTKVLEQVKILARERASATGVDLDEKLKKDITTIQQLIPELMSIKEPAINNGASDALRKQLEEYFRAEKENYEAKLSEESKRRTELEKAAEIYKTRLQEHQNRVKRDQLQEALKKEKHLDGLVEQVLQYLEHGCRMTKIPSKGSAKKRFFFLADDRKKIQSCEMDDAGIPVNRKRPSTTVYLKDIKRVLLGQFTAAFEHFSKDKKRDKAHPTDDIMDNEDGCFNSTPTASVTPHTVSKYFYRSFSFEFKKGKTLDVITETDSDFEAWLVALRKLLGSGADAAPIEWGVPMDITGKPGAEKLNREEARLCSTHHMTPSQYLNAKQEILQRAQTSFVTIYDIRTLSTLDLPRAQDVHEYFRKEKLIADPGE